VADIFQRKRRQRPLHLIGGLFFALLSAVTVVDALRGEPLAYAEGWEAAAWRLGAAAFSAAMATYLIRSFLAARRDEADRLLR